MNSVADQTVVERVNEALEHAETLRCQQALVQARDVLIEALQHNVDTAQVYFRLGNVYFDQKDYEHAEYAYRRAIDHDPLHLNTHHNLAVVFKKQGRITESVKQRRKADKLARQHPERIEFSGEQVKLLRGYAKRMMLFGVGIVAAIALLLVLLSR